jgi:hypothetical protein
MWSFPEKRMDTESPPPIDADASRTAMAGNQAPARRMLRSIGLGAAVILWFLLLVTPCLMFTLATHRYLSLPLVGVAEPANHPLIEIHLLTDIETRGLQITTSHFTERNDRSQCITVQVSYLLWAGSGEPASYCDCYLRDEPDQPWTLRTTGPVCPTTDDTGSLSGMD